MGLDSFWVRPGFELGPDGEIEDWKLEFEPALNLCGGMFSEHGSGSFRGKVYYEEIEMITGVSLFQDRIKNETIREMAAKLVAARGLKDDLARMFYEYGAAGADLMGWW